MWGEMLGVGEVGADSDFFDLGGDSLMAMRIVSRLSKSLKMAIPLSTVFDGRTVATLAARIDSLSTTSDDDTPVASADRDSGGERSRTAPLALGQERLWFLDQLNPGSVSYTVPSSIRFTGHLDQEALRRSLTEIVRRHESLRTTFAASDGQPFQVIHDVRDVDLPVIDLSTLAADQRPGAVRRVATQLASEPWHLRDGPLLRLRLIHISSTEHVLTLAMHHIVTDGRSMGIFAQELAIIYRAFAAKRLSPLPEPKLQYRDYAVWQREWLQSTTFDRERTYWCETLAGVQPLELPTDRARPPVHRYRGAQRTFDLPDALTEHLRRLARDEGATTFMMMLALFQLLLARYSGQDEVTVGTPVANRNRVELENVIGFFVNTLALRTSLHGHLTFRELVQRVARVCLDAYDHANLSFDKVVEALNPRRDLSRHPVFQVLFVHQGSARNALNNIANVSWQPQAVELATSNFDLLLLVNESE
ncbi:MAG: condensation domain-containing protein, partial [Actinobacteria bacterium]|nr:condensation domain-containing protein [Actinomycetota bacterium]